MTNPALLTSPMDRTIRRIQPRQMVVELQEKQLRCPLDVVALQAQPLLKRHQHCPVILLTLPATQRASVVRF
jgi:hypothetical protein